jgi:hypothetical protein
MVTLDAELIVASALTALGALTLVTGFRELSRAFDSDEWPEVSGEIEETGVITGSVDRGGATFAPMVRYHYRIGDNQYVSDRIAFGGTVSMSFRSWAERIAAKYRQSRTVKVRVCPADPTLSVLEPGAHWSLWFIILMGTVFAGIGLRMLLTQFGVFGQYPEPATKHAH